MVWYVAMTEMMSCDQISESGVNSGHSTGIECEIYYNAAG